MRHLRRFSSPSRARTCDNAVNSRALYRLSYRGLFSFCPRFLRYAFVTLLYRLSYRGLSASLQLAARPLPASAPRLLLLCLQNCTLTRTFPANLRSSLRPISIRQLRALLRFHLGPIYLVVFKGSYDRRLQAAACVRDILS